MTLSFYHTEGKTPQQVLNDLIGAVQRGNNNALLGALTSTLLHLRDVDPENIASYANALRHRAEETGNRNFASAINEIQHRVNQANTRVLQGYMMDCENVPGSYAGQGDDNNSFVN